MTKLDVFIAAVWTAVFSIVLIEAIPETAIGASGPGERLTRVLLPEGWAFFTRDPREVQQRVYLEAATGELVAANVAEARSQQWFAADRWYRIRGIAVGQVQQLIPKKEWRECRASLRDCVSSLGDAAVPVTLRMKVPTLCGRVILHEAPPVPWAWRGSHARVNMPGRVVRANIKCTYGERA